MSRFLISPQYNPYLNIAVETALLNAPSDGEMTLYLWQNQYTVVIGQNQNPYAECDVARLEADGGYLMRRRTGGGAVFHDVGNINFSFIAPNGCYDQQRQFGVLQRALGALGLEVEVSGRNDLLCQGRKISGSAFSRGREQRLHHGTLLIDTDVAAMQRYLKPNVAKLQKHGVASVRSRVANIADLLPQTPREEVLPLLRSRVGEAFAQEYGTPQVLDWDDVVSLPQVQQLYEDYASPEWKYGRWQQFRATRSQLFDWGWVEVALTVDEASATISDCTIASDSLFPDTIAEAERLLRGASTLAAPPSDNPIISDILSLLY